MKKRIFSLLAFSLLLTGIEAKIPLWSVKPAFSNLSRYHGDIYAFEENGKWGLMKSDNSILANAENDFITPFCEGYAITGVKEGQRYLIRRIIGEDGSVTDVTTPYYLDSSRYFSEGMLAVADKNHKFGYINTKGQPVVKCHFDLALPFKEGWAPVKTGQFVKYISPAYDRDPSRSILVVDFHYGDMTRGSCFKDGHAVVAYNRDYALIDRNGRVVRKISESEYGMTEKRNNAAPTSGQTGFTETTAYTPYASNGRYGLKEGADVVVAPQFDTFGKQFSDGDIIASMGGRYGILKITDGNVRSYASVSGKGGDTLEARNGKTDPITYVWEGPMEKLKDLKLSVDMGDGFYADVTHEASVQNGRAIYTFDPVFPKNAKSFTVGARCFNDGMYLGESSHKFNVKYPVVIRVSAPGPGTCRANSSDICVVSASIHNDSDSEIVVNYSWSTGSKGAVTVPPHGSRGVSTSVSCTSQFSRTISITANGKSASNTITFIPYF